MWGIDKDLGKTPKLKTLVGMDEKDIESIDQLEYAADNFYFDS